MATSMAAALAASLPAQSSAPAAPAAPKEAIPASKTQAIDPDAKTPITQVQVDGMVASKIVKHGRDFAPGTATGLLMGLDLEGTLEISNSIALPKSSDEEEIGARSTIRYQESMIKMVQEVGGIDNVVGFYQTTSMGAFYKQSLLDTLALHYNKIRHGGVVLIHDIAQTARGNASIRAFRLSPTYLQTRKSGKFNAESLAINGLTFSELFLEIPVVVRNSPLADAFIESVKASNPKTFAPTYSNLSLPPPSATARSLEAIIDSLDAYKSEENNLAYLSRQIAREKAKADAHVAKRKEENALRISQGLVPLPEEDVSRLFKIPAEPSRMESILLLGQLDAYTKDLEGLAGLELAKMYAAKAGSSS